MTQATHLFFDHPYEPDPEERGYYWAPRFTDTRKTFGFMPDNLYANADFKRNGEKITDVCETFYEGKCEQLHKPENIAGKELSSHCLIRPGLDVEFHMCRM
jgi:hexosaminidase